MLSIQTTAFEACVFGTFNTISFVSDPWKGIIRKLLSIAGPGPGPLASTALQNFFQPLSQRPSATTVRGESARLFPALGSRLTSRPLHLQLFRHDPLIRLSYRYVDPEAFLFSENVRYCHDFS